MGSAVAPCWPSVAGNPCRLRGEAIADVEIRPELRSEQASNAAPRAGRRQDVGLRPPPLLGILEPPGEIPSCPNDTSRHWRPVGMSKGVPNVQDRRLPIGERGEGPRVT